MADVHLEYVNEVHCRVSADAGIIMEMSEYFTHFKENYKFDPKFKNKVWDGKIRLLNRMTCFIYRGLALRIKKWCAANGYSFSFDDRFLYDNVSVNEVNEFLDSLNLPEWLERRDYQVDAIVKCLRTKRRLLLSPTSSGKSFMIYAIAMWYKLKTLVIVPTTGLVRQMESDFRSYGFTGVIHTSEDGLLKDNNIHADIVITTWQSLDNGKKKTPKEWFNQFGVVFGDEAHDADRI
jgi:superfamily II DNA or RNA helicase